MDPNQQVLLSEGESALIAGALKGTPAAPENTPKPLTEEDGEQPLQPPTWVDDGEVRH